MSPVPKSPQLPADAQNGVQGERRKYVAPRLKRLGSVRELTLGSPAGKASDGIFPTKKM